MDTIGSVLDNKTHEIGKRCAEFRNNVLHMSQKDFCYCTGTNIKNISAFEHGRANNIRYIFYYYNACETQGQQEQFSDYIFKGVYD